MIFDLCIMSKSGIPIYCKSGMPIYGESLSHQRTHAPLRLTAIFDYGILGISMKKSFITVKNKKTGASYHNNPGFVYLICAKGTSRYKIGITTRTPEQRLSELNSSQSPYPLALVDSIYVENATAAERTLHAKFKHCRRHGEWFEFSPRRVDDVREEFTKVAGTSKRRLSRLQKTLLVCVFCFTVVFVLAVLSAVL